MEIFSKIVALLRVIMPLPDITDAVSLAKWLQAIAPAEADVIVFIANQLRAKGSCEVMVPGGAVVTMVVDQFGAVQMTDYHAGILCSHAAGEILGDVQANGEFLKLLMQYIPVIMQLLSLFLKIPVTPVVPQPTPVPIQ
jgi:hypothetical protein